MSVTNQCVFVEILIGVQWNVSDVYHVWSVPIHYHDGPIRLSVMEVTFRRMYMISYLA